MPDLRLEMDLDAPRDRIFDVLSDHARYDRFRPISASSLLREGTDEANGLGAVRRLKAGAIRFDEEITAFERPARFDYLIVATNIPLHHDGGSIRMTENGGGTHVVWTSSFRATLPLISRPLGPVLERALRRSFTKMLEDAERLSQGSPG